MPLNSPTCEVDLLLCFVVFVLKIHNEGLAFILVFSWFKIYALKNTKLRTYLRRDVSFWTEWFSPFQKRLRLKQRVLPTARAEWADEAHYVAAGCLSNDSSTLEGRSLNESRDVFQGVWITGYRIRITSQIKSTLLCHKKKGGEH